MLAELPLDLKSEPDVALAIRLRPRVVSVIKERDEIKPPSVYLKLNKTVSN